MELTTNIYSVAIVAPKVIVKVCDNYEKTFVCVNNKMTGKFVKRCVEQAITSYVCGG